MRVKGYMYYLIYIEFKNSLYPIKDLKKKKKTEVACKQ